MTGVIIHSVKVKERHTRVILAVYATYMKIALPSQFITARIATFVGRGKALASIIVIVCGVIHAFLLPMINMSVFRRAYKAIAPYVMKCCLKVQRLYEDLSAGM